MESDRSLPVTNPWIVSRWPVRIECPITDGDLDFGGMLTGDAVERVFSEARGAYFNTCSSIPGNVEIERGEFQAGTAATGESAVSVVVAVVEIFNDRFTMQARIRGRDNREVLATARCTYHGEVSSEMREEFIALAHAAMHIG
jgi:acyl-CoA thioesterase FadM